VRFDDSLATILSADTATPFGAQTAWRQLVDLMSRGRVPADPPMLARLAALRDIVPEPVRAASARMLRQGPAPVALVAFFAQDDLPVAGPVLRSVTLADADWLAILPRLTPGTRSILRHRRDLSETVQRGLESFGAVDFVLPHFGAEAVADPEPEFEPVTVAPTPSQPQSWPIARDTPPPPPAAAPLPPQEPPVAEQPPLSILLDPVPTQPATPFVALGQVARTLPFMAEAMRHAEPASAPPRYEIADLVARIDAFNQRREEVAGATPSHAGPAHFDFETDTRGLILGVDGVARGPLVGVSIAETVMQGLAQFDGVAMGAFRRRSPFRDARLEIGGASEAAGSWRVSAMPYFDPLTGQFLGYRGSGRRPRRDEIANAVGANTASDKASSDSLRQLVHELRTPANAVAGFAELIESELLGPVAPVYRDRASAIRSMAADLLASVEDLDTAARIEGRVLELRPTVVPLEPLIRRILAELHPLAELRRAEIRFEAPEQAITALADDRASERLITRLFSVLLSNCVVGERLAAGLAIDQGMAVLRVDRPLALTVETEGALLSEAGDEDQRDGAPLLGTGFSLRLIDKLGAEMGGGLTIGLHRVVLALPLGGEQRAGQASRR